MVAVLVVIALLFFLLGAALAGPLGLWLYLHQRPCPHCRKRVDKRAVICTECGKELEPLRKVREKSNAQV